MQVLFLKDAPGQGRKGEVKDIADGFAKNFLIPKGFARAVSAQAAVFAQQQKQQAEAKHQKELDRWQKQKADLEKRIFSVFVKTGPKGQIFGGINEKDVLASINEKMGTSFERHQLKLAHTVKSLGEQFAMLSFGHGVEARIKLNIQSLEGK